MGRFGRTGARQPRRPDQLLAVGVAVAHDEGHRQAKEAGREGEQDGAGHAGQEQGAGEGDRTGRHRQAATSCRDHETTSAGCTVRTGSQPPPRLAGAGAAGDGDGGGAFTIVIRPLNIPIAHE
jgi:hypothetical protein